MSLDPRHRELALDDGERLALRPAAADHRRRAAPAADPRAATSTACSYLRSVQDSDALRERLDRGGSLVVVGAGWIGAEVAASARQRGLEVTVVEPPRCRSSACSAPRWARSTATSTPTTACSCCWAPASRRSRAPSASSGCARATAARSTCDFVVVGVGVHAAHRAGRRRPGSRSTTASSSTSACRPARPACSPPATSPTPHHPVLRRAHARRALGQRAPPGPGRGAQHARPAGGLRPHAVLLLRPVRRRHGVRGPRARAGIAWCSAATRASREFIAFWLARRARRRRHERQRLGRHRADPAAHPRARRASTTGASPTPTCRSTELVAAPQEATSHEPPRSSCTTPGSRSGSTRSRASCWRAVSSPR